MKKTTLVAFSLLFLLAAAAPPAPAQVTWMVGMRLGLGIGSGGGGVDNPYAGLFYYYPVDKPSRAGFQFGPTAEVIFNRSMAVVEAFNINTSTGTPIEWSSTFKYYFMIPNSTIRPYADAGFSLWFATGGPYVGIPFGGGALFQIARNLYIPADVQFGPIFVTGGAVFGVAITTGIRYEFR